MTGTLRTGLAALAAAALLALAGCILSPGRFAATLDLRKDGQFTFTYTGQIYLLALTQLADMAKQARDGEEFSPTTCYDDDLEERECSDEEVAEQHEEWEAGADERREKAERDSAMMKAMLGGIDPGDPQAAEELAERLRRQEGWKRVEYRGNGLFEVDFALTSHLSHDFAFPTFERFPMINSFVLAHLREGRQVRIEAPGFAAQSGGANPMAGMMGGMAGVFNAASQSEGKVPIPELDGTFRIVTDGRILANNTDEGPRAGPGEQALEWRINKRTQAAPTALIGLAD